MTGADIKRIRRKWKYTLVEMTKRMGISIASMDRKENGRSKIKKAEEAILREIERMG